MGNFAASRPEGAKRRLRASVTGITQLRRLNLSAVCVRRLFGHIAHPHADFDYRFTGHLDDRGPDDDPRHPNATP